MQQQLHSNPNTNFKCNTIHPRQQLICTPFFKHNSYSLFFLARHLFLCFLQYVAILLVTALSSLAIFSKAATLYSLLLLAFLPSKNIFFSLDFTLYFPSPQKEDPWAKAIKFFVALFIYKTLFIFPLRLGKHYFFNKAQTFLPHQESLSFHNKETQIIFSFFLLPSSTRKPN